MTHAQVEASVFVETEHPRAAGGKFGSKGGENSAKSKKPRKGAQPRRTGPHRRTIPAGQLGFDGVRGTGYGHKGGDPQVKALQTELNRLGLRDKQGRKLTVDGKLGPLTTQAIKAAQLRLGMRPTGIIAPAFIDRLKATRSMPGEKAPAKRARKRVRAGGDHFDPGQLRDGHGRWATQPGSAIVDTVRDWAELHVEHGNNGQVPMTAVVDTRNGRRLLLAFEGDGPGGASSGPTPDLNSAVALDDAAVKRLDVAVAEAQDKGAERRKRLKALYAEQDRLGERVRELTAPGEKDPFHSPTDAAVEEQAQAEDRIAAIDEEIGNPDAVYASGTVPTDGGELAWSAYTDDAEDPGLQMQIELPGDDLFLDDGDMRRLREVLRDAMPGEVKAASPVAAAELRGIELARPGKWQLSSGPLTVTEQMLRDAERYANRAGARPGYVKIGHNDPRFATADGEPALGWVENVRLDSDEIGPKLVGDINDMPDWLAAAAHKHWPYRSMEGWADYTDPDTGERYGLVLDGLALLGITPPGMTSLKSLRDRAKAVGIAAASGTRVVASMASAPVAAEEGAGQMDPAITRTALGLAPDASDAEVRDAMLVAYQSLGGDGGPAQQPVQASLFGEEPAPAAKPKTPASDAAAGSFIRVEASAWAAAQERIQRLEAQAQRQREGERDQVIASAVREGKFAPARREHWVRLWNADPEGAREAIDGLARNVIPVEASGYSGGVDDEDIDREFASLFPPVVKG